MKYILLFTFVVSFIGVYAQPAAPTNQTEHRIEGVFTVFEYEITDGSATASGICWNTTGNPSISDNNIERSISGTGVYQDSVTGLTTNTPYYWRAYSRNAGGISYTGQGSFTTQLNAQPGSQPSGLSISIVDSTEVTLSFSTPSFYVAGQIVTGDTPASDELVDETDPALSFDYYTSSSSISIDGLTPNTTYSVSLVYYNATSLTSADCNLNQDNPATITFRVGGVPRTQATNIVTEWASSSSITISCTAGDGDRRLIYMNDEDSFTNPTQETTVNARTSWRNRGQQCVYNGTGTSVTVTGTDDATTYYYRVYEFNNEDLPYYNTNTSTNNPGTYIGKVVWDGSEGTSWTTTGNWKNDNPPGTTSEVIIPDVTNDPVISSSTSVGSVAIQDGGNITVNTGVTLSLSGDLTIKGASGSSGIVCNGTGSVSVSGTSSYERFIDTDGWHLLSTPNSNSSISQLAGIYVNSYNEATADWNNLTGSSSLSVMEGYSVRYGSAGQTVTFTGAFNNETQSTTVTNADPADGTETYGWNLVGNPYPSSIDWDASSGWTRSGINGTVYVYDASASNYVTFNHSTETGPFWIPPTQGFYVYSTVSSTSLQMTNAVRGISSTAYYKKDAEFPIIKLRVDNSIKEDISKIIFHPEATESFDSYFDGYKLFGWSEDLPQVYTISEDEKSLSINTINSQLLSFDDAIVLKLGYTSQIETTLLLTIDEIEGLDDDIQIGLYDKDLKKGST